jgi:hypothetical protein
VITTVQNRTRPLGLGKLMRFAFRQVQLDCRPMNFGHGRGHGSSSVWVRYLCLAAILHCGGATSPLHSAEDSGTDAAPQAEAGGDEQSPAAAEAGTHLDAALSDAGEDVDATSGEGAAPSDATSDEISRDAAAPSDGASNGDASRPPEAGASPCPASVNNLVTPCAPEGLECEFGSDPRTYCDMIATCSGGSWSVADGGASGAPCGPLDPGGICPADYAQLEDAGHASCAPPGTECVYPQGQCSCSEGLLASGRDAGSWACADAPAGCPSTRPLVGTACPQATLTCTYGNCLVAGGIVTCSSAGYWLDEPAVCH